MKRKLRNLLQVIEDHGDSSDKLAQPNVLELKFAAQPLFIDDLIIDSNVFDLIKVYADPDPVTASVPIDEVPQFFTTMFQKTSSAAKQAYQDNITNQSRIIINLELVSKGQHEVGVLQFKFW
uniref:Uncharacterized protein n=1 Tax=Loigolactobacillus rennini TaxID=238013 RepID=A0A1K2I6M6_9LACO|nr:hypothetical protein LREN565_1116 [Loigolactobacillus rennini]